MDKNDDINTSNNDNNDTNNTNNKASKFFKATKLASKFSSKWMKKKNKNKDNNDENDDENEVNLIDVIDNNMNNNDNNDNNNDNNKNNNNNNNTKKLNNKDKFNDSFNDYDSNEEENDNMRDEDISFLKEGIIINNGHINQNNIKINNINDDNENILKKNENLWKKNENKIEDCIVYTILNGIKYTKQLEEDKRLRKELLGNILNQLNDFIFKQKNNNKKFEIGENIINNLQYEFDQELVHSKFKYLSTSGIEKYQLEYKNHENISDIYEQKGNQLLKQMKLLLDLSESSIIDLNEDKINECIKETYDLSYINEPNLSERIDLNDSNISLNNKININHEENINNLQDDILNCQTSLLDVYKSICYLSEASIKLEEERDQLYKWKLRKLKREYQDLTDLFTYDDDYQSDDESDN